VLIAGWWCRLCRLSSLMCHDRKLWSLFGDKKEAITSGVVLDGTQYEVHRLVASLIIKVE
jgi:hypothetical protein